MDTFELIIAFLFLTGIGIIIYIFLRDPVLMIKSLLRGLKVDNSWRYLIVLFPIWGPIWFIDRLFGLGIYYTDFEEISKPRKISFTDFHKYILISTINKTNIKEILRAFRQAYDPIDYNYPLEGSEVKISELNNCIIIKIDSILFKSFNSLILFIDNSSPKDQVYKVKGVLLNKSNFSNSFYTTVDSTYPLKLVGKTKSKRKIYIDLRSEKDSEEIIYFNPDLEFIKDFNFNSFEADLRNLSFTNI